MDPPGPDRPSPTISSSTPRYACFCGKSYLRKEHLRRHQAVHYQGTHTCEQCGATFARKDSLRRHVKDHPAAARRLSACYACRVSKAKCDGEGKPCSRCRRRKIACVYSASSSDMSGSLNAASPVPTVDRLVGHPDPPSPPAPAEEYTVLHSGEEEHSQVTSESVLLTAILDGILNDINEPLSSRDLLNSTEPRTRIVAHKALNAYIEQFHRHWTFIHTVTIDLQEQPRDTCAMVILIGAYCWNLVDPSLGIDMSLFTHILDKLIESLVQTLFFAPNLDIDSEPWPYPLYQRALLTIIWALYFYEEDVTLRARRLTDLLVASLRSADFFSGETATRQREQYMPGEFLPFRYMIEQQQKSLITFLFKIDAHLAVITQQPPALHACELDVSLPSTFSQLNCYGVYAFESRHNLLEPLRPSRLLSDFLGSFEPAATFGTHILIEDVHLGLCGIVSQLWELAHAHRSDSDLGKAHRLHNDISLRLRFWCGHLLALRSKTATDKELRSAYVAAEEHPDETMLVLFNETLAFYHLLGLLASTYAPSRLELMDTSSLSRAAMLPPQAMRSVYHAVCIGALYMAGEQAHRCCAPMLQQARIFASEYIVNMLGDSCCCNDASMSSYFNLALLDAQLKRENDVCNMLLGKIWLYIDGSPLCACGESEFLTKTGLAD